MADQDCGVDTRTRDDMARRAGFFGKTDVEREGYLNRWCRRCLHNVPQRGCGVLHYADFVDIQGGEPGPLLENLIPRSGVGRGRCRMFALNSASAE